MAIDKNDILEALGIRHSGMMEWMGPALIGFGVGALVGGVTALMLAPKTGEDLREQLRDKVRDLTKKARDQVSEIGDPMQAPRNF